MKIIPAVFCIFSISPFFRAFFLVSAMENISVLLKRFPNEAICGGVLLPGHRVISASGCIPSNFTNIKVQLPGTLDLLNIRSVVRNKIAIINFEYPFWNEVLGSPVVSFDFNPERIPYGKYLKAVSRLQNMKVELRDVEFECISNKTIQVDLKFDYQKYADLLGDGLFNGGELIGIRTLHSTSSGIAFYISLKAWMGLLY